MIPNNQKTSLLVPFQLPEYVRDNPDYSNFVTFLQAYYEWMEQTGQVTDASKNLLNYTDIDNTTSEFLDYFINDFLPYFPEDALISKDKAVKVARQLYQSKGTPSSYQFLFRILYNSDFDYVNTGDLTLKASDGTWYVPKSLKLATDDPRFLELNANNLGAYRAFGETSKSFATIEYVTFASNKTEVFISNIERLFQSGEMIRIVDTNNQDIIIDGTNLTAKLVGQISQININPNNRGLFYDSGDPVIVYGGLNPDITNPVGATAEVGTVTSGSVQKINVTNGGYGYTLDSSLTNEPANSAIVFSNLNSGAAAPIAIVGSVSSQGESNVSLIPSDTITLKQYHYIGNIAGSSGANTQNPTTGLWTQQPYQFANNLSANANTSLANAFSFLSFSTFPISSVLVENGGGGITTEPTISAISKYETDVSGNQGLLSNLGILAPIQISNGGNGYQVNDVINFLGGVGYGAHANVTNVDSNGAITSVSYVYKNETPHHYPLGGMGYTNQGLPSLTVTSANSYASNASLYVPGILGTGATFSLSVDRAGSITTINIINPGEDYISTPNVSLKVQDIVVSNVGITFQPDVGDVIFQGGSNPNTATYFAYFDSLTQLTNNLVSSDSLWNLRVFNYSGQPNPTLPLKNSDAFDFSNSRTDVSVLDLSINYLMANSSFAQGTFANTQIFGESTNGANPAYNSEGIINYGDGTAQATATFLNGLVVGQGQYIDFKGQPSGFSVLPSQDYNNFTYQITVNKEIQKYRDVLLNLLHPSGTKVIGRYAIETQNVYDFDSTEITNKGYSLYYYTQTAAANVTMSTTLSNPGTNIIQFNNLSGANLANILVANSSLITMTSTEGTEVSGIVTSIDSANNRATLNDYVFLSYSNVAYVTANTNTTTININSITNAYYYVNNNVFLSNTPLQYIVYSGDTVTIGSNNYTVASVNAVSNTITTTSNIVSGVSNTLMAVNRNFSAGGSLANANNIIIWNTIGTQYFPEITDESGNSIITEGGDYILLG